MSVRGTLARRLVFAGAATSPAAWALGDRRRVDEPVEEKPLIPDDIALAAARGLDPPRSRRPFRSRLAASLVFATIFCAGAALTAGAGNEVSRVDATPLAEATTTATEAEAPAERKAPAALQIPFSALAFDPAAWLNDNPASPTGASAVALSAHYLGVPYVWGGAAPGTGFDCSGLTMFVYNQLGVRLPHYAAAQFAMFPKLSAVD